MYERQDRIDADHSKQVHHLTTRQERLEKHILSLELGIKDKTVKIAKTSEGLSSDLGDVIDEHENEVRHLLKKQSDKMATVNSKIEGAQERQSRVVSKLTKMLLMQKKLESHSNVQSNLLQEHVKNGLVEGVDAYLKAVNKDDMKKKLGEIGVLIDTTKLGE